MIQGNINNSPVRRIKGKVEFFEGSALLGTYSYKDRLKSFTVERLGEDSKFFGFGVCQKINIKLLDKDRELDITKNHSFKAYLASEEETDFITPYPIFYVTEVTRDEKTNELTITAYDTMYPDSAHLVSDMILQPPYTVRDFAQAAALALGTKGIKIIGVGEEETCFNTVYPEGANFEGSETIREALNDVAEATQTIFYIDYEDYLVFKRIDKNADAALTIYKKDYFDLISRTNRRLTRLVHTTELGDNVSSEFMVGTTQFIRDNGFWANREDIATLLDNAIAVVRGLTINQFDCSWRGNYLLEIGDKIDLVTKNEDVVTTFVFNDTVEYDGALRETTLWKYTDNDAETEAAPSNLGTALNQTFAKVDKINRTIDLVASESQENGQKISALEINTGSISASVSKMETELKESIGDISEDIANLATKVESTITAEDLTIAVKKEVTENGVTKVVTNTGFKFDDEGLTVSKENSEMSTQITEDGMTVFKNNEEVLVADNTGVKAINLHAQEYLIIGTYSRFEDYDYSRTGCFWVGPSEVATTYRRIKR
jgi:hypothetical protein